MRFIASDNAVPGKPEQGEKPGENPPHVGPESAVLPSPSSRVSLPVALDTRDTPPAGAPSVPPAGEALRGHPVKQKARTTTLPAYAPAMSSHLLLISRYTVTIPWELRAVVCRDGPCLGNGIQVMLASKC